MCARRGCRIAGAALSATGAATSRRHRRPRRNAGSRAEPDGCAGHASPISPARPHTNQGRPMAETRFDVLTIGNAIVDIIAPIDPGFLEREGMSEGIMHLIDEARSIHLYDLMPADKRQVSGGSAANTAAGVAALGGRAAFVGKVADDPLGDIF